MHPLIDDQLSVTESVEFGDDMSSIFTLNCMLILWICLKSIRLTSSILSSLSSERLTALSTSSTVFVRPFTVEVQLIAVAFKFDIRGFKLAQNELQLGGNTVSYLRILESDPLRPSNQ